MIEPLVSVIVPTKNSSQFLAACLRSIKKQSYGNIELIVVDNNSTDITKKIANRYTDKVYNRGPERSAQRNYGVRQANGVYVAIIDSDMELAPTIIAASIQVIRSEPSARSVIIPEESFGNGFWASCKRLERSFYVGVEWMEAARFFDRGTYLAAGGYDEAMVSGEDWDLSYRIGRLGKIVRIQPFIRHNEGNLRLMTTLKKKYYYAKEFSVYMAKQPAKADDLPSGSQTSLIARYWLYFRQPIKLFKNPLLGLGMLFMKTLEFTIGAIGLLHKRNVTERYIAPNTK